MSRVVTIEGQIEQAKMEDLYKPWIRVSKNKRKDIPNKTYVKVRANNKTVYCQIRGTSNEDSKRIQMSEHYRELLGWENLPIGNIKLEITRINQFWGMIRAFLYHPDDVVRVGVGLSTASMSIALVSLFISIFKSISLTTFWPIIISSCTILFAVGVLIGATVSFLKPLRS
jgi:hypothetical protein